MSRPPTWLVRTVNRCGWLVSFVTFLLNMITAMFEFLDRPRIRRPMAVVFAILFLLPAWCVERCWRRIERLWR